MEELVLDIERGTKVRIIHTIADILKINGREPITNDVFDNLYDKPLSELRELLKLLELKFAVLSNL